VGLWSSCERSRCSYPAVKWTCYYYWDCEVPSIIAPRRCSSICSARLPNFPQSPHIRYPQWQTLAILVLLLFYTSCLQLSICRRAQMLIIVLQFPSPSIPT
jgi:hypothetical protein